jgi:hypothetical protein
LWLRSNLARLAIVRTEPFADRFFSSVRGRASSPPLNVKTTVFPREATPVIEPRLVTRSLVVPSRRTLVSTPAKLWPT